MKYEFGPYLLPLLLLMLGGLAGLAHCLLVSGIQQRSAWRLALGAPIAVYLVAVAIAAVRS